MNDSDPDRPKDLDDLTPADFVHQLTGGGGRWLFTLLAVLSLVALAMTLADPDTVAYFPIKLSGTTAIWVISAVAVIWWALALVNWRNWRRR